MSGRLKSLFLFLLFRDPYAGKTYTIDDLGFLAFMACSLPAVILVLGGAMFWLLAIHPLAFLGAYVSLIYVLLQLGHLYDYFRGRR